jgi:predicted small secreted protein
VAERTGEGRFLEVGVAFGGWGEFGFDTMKTLNFLLVVLLCFGVASCEGLQAVGSDVSSEGLGKLALDQKAAVVLELLGEPKSKGADVLMEATGEWVQEWAFPEQGLTVMMGSTEKGGAKTVWSITADGKCQLATERGVRIGSSEAEVRRAYEKFYNAEESRAGETLVAGSVYGGVIFEFEKGKVAGIFIGAAAE